MNIKEKINSFEITIENGIGLIIAGILLQILGGFTLFIVPIALGAFGVFQIVKGHSKEGIPNLAIAVIIALLSGFAKGLIKIAGGILIGGGIIILILAIIGRKK